MAARHRHDIRVSKPGQHRAAQFRLPRNPDWEVPFTLQVRACVEIEVDIR
jgi:hypothetical protein